MLGVAYGCSSKRQPALRPERSIWYEPVRSQRQLWHLQGLRRIRGAVRQLGCWTRGWHCHQGRLQPVDGHRCAL